MLLLHSQPPLPVPDVVWVLPVAVATLETDEDPPAPSNGGSMMALPPHADIPRRKLKKRRAILALGRMASTRMLLSESADILTTRVAYPHVAIVRDVGRCMGLVVRSKR